MKPNQASLHTFTGTSLTTVSVRSEGLGAAVCFSQTYNTLVFTYPIKPELMFGDEAKFESRMYYVSTSQNYSSWSKKLLRIDIYHSINNIAPGPVTQGQQHRPGQPPTSQLQHKRK